MVCEFEPRSAAQHSVQHTQRDNILTEPSCCANIFPSSSSGQNKCINSPAMTDEERHLLKENKGCFKCYKPFAGHLARDSACDFSSPINYKLHPGHTVPHNVTQKKLPSKETHHSHHPFQNRIFYLLGGSGK